MSHNGLHVNHGSLAGAAADLKTTVNQMTAALSSLDDDIKKDVATWTGAENGQRAAYDQAKLKWDTAMTELTNLLDTTSTTVDTSNQDYRSADIRGAHRFS